MQLKHIRDIQPKFLRGLYSSSVFVQPLGTTACRAVLEYRRAARALDNLDY